MTQSTETEIQKWGNVIFIQYTYTKVAGFDFKVAILTDLHFSGVPVPTRITFYVIAKQRTLSWLESALCLPIWSYPIGSILECMLP